METLGRVQPTIPKHTSIKIHRVRGIGKRVGYIGVWYRLDDMGVYI